jgi:hypothetical protein
MNNMRNVLRITHSHPIIAPSTTVPLSMFRRRLT